MILLNEIEKAKKDCKQFIEENKDRPIELHKSIEILLQEIDNRIPKEKIEICFNKAMNECEDSFDWFDLENLKQDIFRKENK